MAHGKHPKRYPMQSMEAKNWAQFKLLLARDKHADKWLTKARAMGYVGDDAEEARQFVRARVWEKPAVRERIAESVQPLRDLSALREEAKQNRYAAELWKHHTETAKKTLLIHAKVLDLLADKLLHEGLGAFDDIELAGILRDAAKAMREAS